VAQRTLTWMITISRSRELPSIDMQHGRAITEV